MSAVDAVSCNRGGSRESVLWNGVSGHWMMNGNLKFKYLQTQETNSNPGVLVPKESHYNSKLGESWANHYHSVYSPQYDWYMCLRAMDCNDAVLRCKMRPALYMAYNLILKNVTGLVHLFFLFSFIRSCICYLFTKWLNSSKNATYIMIYSCISVFL